jgi:uncharacterized repeat protein (TIGR02543 family)
MKDCFKHITVISFLSEEEPLCLGVVEMVSKSVAGIAVVIVVVCVGVVAYLLARPSKYTLTTSVNPPGSGSVSPSSGTYSAGTSVTLIATPASGYVFNHWGGDASGTSTSITITMDSNKDVVAYFARAED